MNKASLIFLMVGSILFRFWYYSAQHELFNFAGGSYLFRQQLTKLSKLMTSKTLKSQSSRPCPRLRDLAGLKLKLRSERHEIDMNSNALRIEYFI